MKKHVLVSLSTDNQNARIGESLGIRYIKSYLNRYGYSADILENQFLCLSPRLLCQKLNKYDVIGFSINYCGQIAVLRDVLNGINYANKIVYLGGHFATICYQSLLQEFSSISFVMLADGEYSTLALAQSGYCYTRIPNVAYIEYGKIVRNPCRMIDDLDSLPFPYRDNNSFYMGDKHFSVVSSRGCYNNCSYCSVGSFTNKFYNRKVRLRSAANIFEELVELKNEHGIQYVSFQDDLFVGNDAQSQQRAQDLAKLMITNKLNIFFSIQCSVKAVNKETFSLLYKAGLRNVMIGIENFSEHALKSYNKRQSKSDIDAAINIIRSVGIALSFGFIMFYPEMMPSEFLENIELLYKYNLINLRSITSQLVIYLGTQYCERTIDEIRFAKSSYSIEYHFKDERIQLMINSCLPFSQLYKHIEQKLYRLEFLSHTNAKISYPIVNKLFDEFRGYIYLFSKSKYYEVFEGKPALEPDVLHSKMNILESSIDILYHDAGIDVI